MHVQRINLHCNFVHHVEQAVLDVRDGQSSSVSLEALFNMKGKLRLKSRALLWTTPCTAIHGSESDQKVHLRPGC